MSASPIARQASEIKAIPRRILISDPTEIPGSYSSTPGGTLFSTTPGGTKIVYERQFLINLRNSPISKTPPSWDIPEELAKGSSPKSNKMNGAKRPNNRYHNHHNNHVKHNGTNHDDTEQFQLDM